MTNDKKIFEEFPPITTAEWEAKILEDLKGADYNRKLIWKTVEGFDVKPYYTSENLENLEYLNTLPGEFNYVRGNTDSKQWEICQNIYTKNISTANASALNALKKGVTTIVFVINDDTVGCQDDFDALMRDIPIKDTKIRFISGNPSPDSLVMFVNYVDKHGIDKKALTGALDFDPLRYLTIRGNFYYGSENRAFDRAFRVVRYVRDQLPQFKALAVNGQHFHNAGGTAVHDLAFTLAMGNEYVARLTEHGLPVDDIASRMYFTFAVGSNYFMEIAKLRAARLLWSNIIKAYNPDSVESCKMYIHTITSSWNKSTYTPYINMLRTTTESMSAILGGADSLTVQPFDMRYRKPDDFSERMARNTQLILSEEAYFDKVTDPAAGSYYIENLTDAIAQHAWELFQKVEAMGGYLAAFKAGFIQDQIEEIARQRNINLALRRDNLLGVNQFPHFAERMKEKIDFNVYSKKDRHESKPIGRPLVPYYGAKAIEDIRIKTEKHSKKAPRAFMLTYGNPAMRRARAGFSCNFLACGGFQVLDNNGFDNLDEGIQAALQSAAEIVVLCSSDEEYTATASAVFNTLKEKTIVAIAGYPQDSVEQLKQLGIKHFIHLRSDLIESLREFQRELGI